MLLQSSLFRSVKARSHQTAAFAKHVPQVIGNNFSIVLNTSMPRCGHPQSGVNANIDLQSDVHFRNFVRID